MPFEIHRKHMVIILLCLIILSACAIINYDVSAFLKIPSGQWLLQKLPFTKDNITGRYTRPQRNKKIHAQLNSTCVE